MFKAQNNVPEVYVNESRDFQLFTRLFDSAYNSTKFTIDEISSIVNTEQINYKLLPLLSYKLGFFDDIQISERNERLLLQAIPPIFRKKGSLDAIADIIRLYCRMYNVKGRLYKDVGSDIQLIFDDVILNESWLFQLIRYVIPTGYQLTQIAGLTKEAESNINVVMDGDLYVEITTDKDNTLELTKTPTDDNSLRQTILTLRKTGE